MLLKDRVLCLPKLLGTKLDRRDNRMSKGFFLQRTIIGPSTQIILIFGVGPMVSLLMEVYDIYLLINSPSYKTHVSFLLCIESIIHTFSLIP